MKHVMSDGKSLLIGDDAADLLIRYAVLLGQSASADSVELNAVESAGNDSRVVFLLNSGSSLTVESVSSHLQAPDNTKEEEYLVSRITAIERLRHPSLDDFFPSDGDDLPH